MPHVRPLSPEDADDVRALQELLEAAPDYSRRVLGRPPRPADAGDVLTALPPGLERARKTGLGLRADPGAGGLLAFADVLHGWPRAGVAHVGLLVVHEQRRGRGLGRLLHDRVVEQALGWGDVDRLRLGIVATNADAAEPFWRALGYRPTGEVTEYVSGEVQSSTATWERELVHRGAGRRGDGPAL
ncbi:GNAT family N-acetyltransferase [Cellulomonas hominis]|uniref:GNAT family N-acetyltransferase n=1 Tax=Cellulomonas hominis TaxID=156981 RepID=UPI001BCDB1E1|nr:GNAT family N-acetyltransferase [Cellulomonas hominis]